AALLVSAGAVALLWALRALRTRRGQRLRLALTTLSVLGLGLIVAVLAFQAVMAVAGGADLQECGTRAKATETGERQPTAAGGGLFSLVETGLNARGGSLRARLGIYEASIESWKKRPVLGWATQRYSAELFLPLGSHSMYLGTLYQRGILGLAVLLALIGYAFWRLIGGFRRSNDARLKLFLGCAAVSCGAASLAGILDILDVDVIVQVLYWTLLGLIIGAAASAGRDDAGEESGDGP
ncbi:MAG: O-antigen polymerase, partial [Rubrobacteraceae bacterium]|nr:O-antigen polymerase [Rubrobacteraceae bacterium]